MTTTTAPKKKLPKRKAPATKQIVDRGKHQNKIATVPDTEFFTRYKSRKIIGELSEFDIFDAARTHRENVLIEGPTGPGKTSAVLAWAAKNDRPFYAIPSNIGIEPSQLFGKYIPNPNRGEGQSPFIWQDGPVTDIVRYGGVLLINEVNFMPERVSTVLFGLFDVRRTIALLDHQAEVIHAHSDLLVVADMNPEYEGTRPLNKAFRNRFHHQLFWDYDETVEAALVSSGTLLDVAGGIREQIRRGTVQTPVSTNMLMEFEKIAHRLGVDYAVLNFVNHFQKHERDPLQETFRAVEANLRDDFKSKEEREKEEAERAAARAAQGDDDTDEVEEEPQELRWFFDDDDNNN